jgi:hypothetical protein
LIDRIRHDIQQRVDQLLTEADKLRRALAALAPGGRSAPKPKPRARSRSLGIDGLKAPYLEGFERWGWMAGVGLK